jgi:hypothetical protein
MRFTYEEGSIEDYMIELPKVRIDTRLTTLGFPGIALWKSFEGPRQNVLAYRGSEKGVGEEVRKASRWTSECRCRDILELRLIEEPTYAITRPFEI